MSRPFRQPSRSTVRPVDETFEFTTVVTGIDAAQSKEVSYWIDATRNAGLGETAPEYRQFASLSQLAPGAHTVVAYVDNVHLKYSSNAIQAP